MYLDEIERIILYGMFVCDDTFNDLLRKIEAKVLYTFNKYELIMRMPEFKEVGKEETEKKKDYVLTTKGEKEAERIRGYENIRRRYDELLKEIC